MRDQLQTLINPIFRTGLTLREEWTRGAGPPFDAGRELLLQAFRELFVVYPATPQVPGANSAPPLDPGFDLLGGSEAAPAPSEPYLGVGYAMACWVDELFTLNSPVAGPWNERKFEAEFYVSNDRAWRFWRQARSAADRPGDDDLEVFYLCAVLGFRGEWIEDPAQLRAWFGVTRERIVKALRKDWAGPPALAAPAKVPPRYGKGRLRRMALVAGLAVLVCIPAAIFLVARQLAK